MKIQTKITLLFLAISTGILLLLNAFILYFEYQFNYQDFFKRLEARVNLTAQTRLFPGEKSEAYQEVRNKYLEKLDQEKEIVIKANAEGVFINTGFPDEFFNSVINNGRDTHKGDDQFYAGKLVTRGNEKFMVIVSATNPYGLNEIHALQKILLSGFFCGKGVFALYLYSGT